MRAWKLVGVVLLVLIVSGLLACAGESHKIVRYDGYVAYVSKDGRQLGLKPAPDSQAVTLYIVDERVKGAKNLRAVISKLGENAFVTIRYYTKINVKYVVGLGWPYREQGST